MSKVILCQDVNLGFYNNLADDESQLLNVTG